jgi:hypothetical protein
MSIFGETPPVSIVGFILTILFFIIHLIGFASPVWNYKSNVGFTSIMDCGNAVSQEINTQNVHC